MRRRHERQKAEGKRQKAEEEGTGNRAQGTGNPKSKIENPKLNLVASVAPLGHGQAVVVSAERPIGSARAGPRRKSSTSSRPPEDKKPSRPANSTSASAGRTTLARSGCRKSAWLVVRA